jgi:hypothetical protein
VYRALYFFSLKVSLFQKKKLCIELDFSQTHLIVFHQKVKELFSKLGIVDILK